MNIDKPALEEGGVWLLKTVVRSVLNVVTLFVALLAVYFTIIQHVKWSVRSALEDARVEMEKAQAKDLERFEKARKNNAWKE